MLCRQNHGLAMDIGVEEKPIRAAMPQKWERLFKEEPAVMAIKCVHSS